MARELSLIKLIELGTEFCGSYSLSGAHSADLRQNDGEKAVFGIPALSSVKKLSAFVERMKGFPGHAKATKALPYILGNSGSPMETALVMLLTLPYRFGGFGLPAPELNSTVRPLKSAKRSSSKKFYRCDLFWPDYDLAVEYDSDAEHTGSLRIAEDSKRRNTISSLGILMIIVTKQQIYSDLEFEKVAMLLASNLGRQLRYQKKEFVKNHRELRKQML